jgi:integrase
MTRRKRKQKWKYRVGERGARVTVYEIEGSRMLQARVWNPAKHRYERRSLGHGDRDRAMRFAHAEVERLKQGRAVLDGSRITVARLFALYNTHRTPSKSQTEQSEDGRRSEMWSRFLGAVTDPHDISLGQWEEFARLRESGSLDARGRPVSGKDRKPMRKRTVRADLMWLKWVLNWGAKWRESGSYLLRENPARGYMLPEVKNTRRPVATTDRYESVRPHTDKVEMAVYVNGKRTPVRSYLSETLDIAYETGRRLGAILNLRCNDFDPDATDENGETLLYGAIRWRGQFDKQGKEWVTPIGPITRAALDRIKRERPGIGDAPLFPSRDNRTKPITRHVVDTWLRKAEQLAEVAPQDGSLWHAYRRGWATARKNLNPIDTAYAGGWSSPATMQKCYQHATMSDMLEVVTAAVELREKKA